MAKPPDTRPLADRNDNDTYFAMRTLPQVRPEYFRKSKKTEKRAAKKSAKPQPRKQKR